MYTNTNPPRFGLVADTFKNIDKFSLNETFVDRDTGHVYVKKDPGWISKTVELEERIKKIEYIFSFHQNHFYTGDRDFAEMLELTQDTTVTKSVSGGITLQLDTNGEFNVKVPVYLSHNSSYYYSISYTAGYTTSTLDLNPFLANKDNTEGEYLPYNNSYEYTEGNAPRYKVDGIISIQDVTTKSKLNGYNNLKLGFKNRGTTSITLQDVSIELFQIPNAFNNSFALNRYTLYVDANRLRNITGVGTLSSNDVNSSNKRFNNSNGCALMKGEDIRYRGANVITPGSYTFKVKLSQLASSETTSFNIRTKDSNILDKSISNSEIMKTGKSSVEGPSYTIHFYVDIPDGITSNNNFNELSVDISTEGVIDSFAFIPSSIGMFAANNARF